MKMFSVTLASGLFLITISALGQLYLPHLRKYGKFLWKQGSPPSSEVKNALHQSLDADQVSIHLNSKILVQSVWNSTYGIDATMVPLQGAGSIHEFSIKVAPIRVI